jgi:vacuolar-type H+-ATPase subunit H
MQKRNITHSVEAMENQAEKILNDARVKADSILLKADKDADELLNSELLMDEVDAKCQDIINKATAKADKQIKDASKQISRMKVHADKNIEAVVERIVEVVTGAHTE